MKPRTNIFKLLQLTILFAGMVAFASCVKDYAPLQTQFSGNLQANAGIMEGGVANFGNTSLSFPPSDPSDTLVFHVNLASVNVPASDVVFTLGFDAGALSSYNAGSSIKYQKFPDSIYSFTQTKVTVKAGTNYAIVKLVVYPGKVDPTQNYMLPISITDAAGTQISANFGTIYYHFIGNPLAGTYSWDFTRYNVPSIDPTKISGLSFTGHSTIIQATSPTSLEVASGYFIQPRYEISFDNNGGVIGNFSVSLNADDVATMAANGVTVTSGPTILLADPVNKKFTFQYTTNARYIIDSYYK